MIKKIYRKIKPILPLELKIIISKTKKDIFLIYHQFRCAINKALLFQKFIGDFDKIHIGCGDVRMPNYLNVDFRATKATDITHNCANLDIFPQNTYSVIFANAFLEHLYRKQCMMCLKSAQKILKPDGVMVVLGLPDFRRIAQAYINKEEGIVSEKFDLFDVYRYTHGDPEQYPDWWLQQLHKSLFDRDKIATLLTQSGFRKYCIFRYFFGKEKIPVSLGFLAFKKNPTQEYTIYQLKKLLSTFGTKINLKTVEIINK